MKERLITVREYIAGAPKEARDKLRRMRAAIREAAPGATERTDYFQIPGYSYRGYGYDGMFAWFSYKASFVRLHVRPWAIQQYKKELSSYLTTKAIASFPNSRPVPMALVKKLVKASVKDMKSNDSQAASK